MCTVIGGNVCTVIGGEQGEPHTRKLLQKKYTYSDTSINQNPLCGVSM